MSDRDRRLIAQFSGTGETAPVWEAFALLFDTDRFLNMGYSPWYLPHAVGSSQDRLARYMGRQVALELGYSAGVSLLDAGCGRGGPTLTLARRFGFDVTGVDLVAHNVEVARENAAESAVDAEFCVGDVRQLPVATDAVEAAVVVDAAQYVAEMDDLFAELSRVTAPGGVVAVSDLALAEGLDTDQRAAVERFADAWDMAVPQEVAATRTDAEEAGLTALRIEDVTAHSVGRFGVWADLFLAAERTPLGSLGERVLGRAGVDLPAVRRQVEATRPALPHLRHVVVVGRT